MEKFFLVLFICCEKENDELKTHKKISNYSDSIHFNTEVYHNFITISQSDQKIFRISRSKQIWDNSGHISYNNLSKYKDKEIFLQIQLNIIQNVHWVVDVNAKCITSSLWVELP